MSPTSSDLTELRRLMEAATPGPWALTHCVGDAIITVGDTVTGEGLLILADSCGKPSGTADYALIVATRNALPALLAAAEERDALKAEVADTKRMLFDTVEQLELRRDSVLWKDLQTVMAQHNGTIAERDALKAENARLRALISEAREALGDIRDLTPQAANTVSADGHHEATALIARAALAEKEPSDAAE